MNTTSIFLYILKTTLVAGVFLGYYWLALRNKKFHRYNRFYLLLSLGLSVIIPLLTFTWFTLDRSVVYGTNDTLTAIISSSEDMPGPTSWNWVGWCFFLFTSVAAGFLLMAGANIRKVYRLKNNYPVTRLNGMDFIDTEEDDAPFSYLKNLFWKRSISLEHEDGQRIFKHELAHIRQNHTLDRLFCQVLCAVMWINPFYWIIQKEILTIHEFIADEEAIGDSGAENFAKMLLRAHYGNHFLQRAPSFFYSSIKRRLFMLTTTRNTRFGHLRRLIIFPLLVMTLAIFSFRITDGNALSTTAGPERSSVNAVTTQQDSLTKKTASQNRDKRSSVTQEDPKFPGGNTGWQKFLARTIRHDLVVQKGGPPGKYVVDLSFIIEKDGKVTDVQALTDPGFGTKEEAIRVLSAGPKWVPAKQNGKPVIYRNRLSITFVVSAD